MTRRPARPLFVLSVSPSVALLGAVAATASGQVTTPPSTGDRVLGLDVSAWQSNILQQTWNNIYNIENRQFVFIRASRGGTTGYYNQSNAGNDNPPGQNTLSQRYDDPYYVQNITRATAAGLLAGSYHFSRPDIVEGTLNSGGIRNNGTDEANHFIQMAGPWMRPGYLLPVHDFEAGAGARTNNDMAQFVLDFSNRIYEVMGIRPAIYTGGSYVSILQNASSSLRTQVVNAHPTLWTPRWPNQSNPNSIPVQTAHPGTYTSTIYGPWDDAGNTHPWTFWQYTSTGRLQSFNNGGSNLDLNVAQGNIEFVKDQLVPAVWMSSTGGNFHDLANWNSGQAPIAPVQGPGQVARVGPLTLPTPRLPGQPDPVHTRVTGADDTINLNRPNENITVTLSQGTYNIRRLNLNERLNVTGGSLDARLTGWVSTGGTLSLSGGNLTFTDGYVNNGGVLDFSGSGTLNVGTLHLAGNPTFTGASGTGQILAKAGVASPSLDLTGGTRTFTVNDGSAGTDLRVALPLTNGNLTKQGAGTIELTGNNSAYTGTLTVGNGHLLLTNANQIGTTGVRTSQSTATTGGSVRVQGNGLNFTRNITLGGLGAGGTSGGGALQNVSGNNTWSGNVLLSGANHNQGQTGLNQIGSASGTLTLSGVIQNAAGTGTSWAKVGAGDVVLTGNSPNTYTNLTRTFGGRLILEKDGALGAAGSAAAADGNTFMLPGANSGIAFRARSGQAGLDYNTSEWIFTEGGGINGAQVDSLGGTNTFAGHLGLGGASANGRRSSSIGVAAGSLEVEGGLYARFYSNPADPAAAEADTRRDIAKRGAGTLILSGDSGPAPTNASARALVDSSFTVEAGTVVLKGTAGNTANVPGVSTWRVDNGATLSLDRSGSAGAADLRLNGGRLHTAAAGVSADNTITTDASGAGGSIETAGAGASLTVHGALNNAAGKAVQKTGAGTLTLNGPQAHGAGASFTAAGGTTNFNTDAGSNASRNLAVAVNNGARVNFNAVQHLAALDVQAGGRAALSAGGNKVLKTGDLDIASTGALDMNDNDLLVDYAPGASAYDQVRQYVINGFLTGTGGITSTVGQAARNTIMAVFDNAEIGFGSWAGESIDGTTVVGKYTYFGDGNLDGQVTVDDYAIIDRYLGITSNARWYQGDFNLDGQVTVDDYALIDRYLGLGTGDPLVVDLQQQMIAQHTALFGDAYTTALAALEAGGSPVVPEPGTVGATLLTMTGLLLRRRRR